MTEYTTPTVTDEQLAGTHESLNEVVDAEPSRADRITQLEQRLATKDALIESLKLEQLAKVEELEKLERELEEAREVHEHERNNLIQTAQAHQRAHRAAEARLAAVTAIIRAEMMSGRFKARLLDALSAPAEPKVSTWCPEDASPSNPNLRGKP